MGKRIVAMRSPSAKRSCMVSACSMILFLVFILYGRVVVIFVGGVLCSPERILPRSSWSSEVIVVLLLSFPPTIGLVRVVGLGIEIGWVEVGRVHMWCLLCNVGMGVAEVCIWWF